MILLVNGCSHAAGSDIDPLDIQPRGWSPEKAFGRHVADELGMEYANIALPGGSNERILRTTVEWVGRHSNEAVFVLVAWTGPARFEFYDEGIGDWKNVCPGVEQTIWYAHLSQLAREYFKYHMLVRATPVELATKRWLDVLLLQEYLRHKGIAHLFCNAYDVLDQSAAFEHFVTGLDQDRYFAPFDGDRTFWHSLKKAGYAIQDPLFGWRFPGFQGHFGEEGHRSFGGLLAEVIRARRLLATVPRDGSRFPAHS